MFEIVIADDHKIFRDGLKLLIKKEKNLCLVGEATNGHELVNLLKEKQPDVVLTDIKMPVLDGIEAVKQILSIQPDIKTIALSMFDEEELVCDMFEAGAKGYLIKDAEKEEILEAIDQVTEGKLYFSRKFSPKLVQLLARSKYNPFKEPTVQITKKELMVIEYMMEDLTSKEIANKLDVNVRTIEWYKGRLMEKMNVKSSTGIVVYAIKHKLVKIK